MSFLELCRLGKIEPDSIDDYISEWHDGTDTRSLSEFLGMTKDQYQDFVFNGPSAIYKMLEGDQ